MISPVRQSSVPIPNTEWAKLCWSDQCVAMKPNCHTNTRHAVLLCLRFQPTQRFIEEMSLWHWGWHYDLIRMWSERADALSHGFLTSVIIATMWLGRYVLWFSWLVWLHALVSGSKHLSFCFGLQLLLRVASLQVIKMKFDVKFWLLCGIGT